MEEIHSNPLSKKIMVIVLLPSGILTAFVSTAGSLSQYSLLVVEFSLLNSLGTALPFRQVSHEGVKEIFHIRSSSVCVRVVFSIFEVFLTVTL